MHDGQGPGRQPLLDVRNLTVGFGRVLTLHGVSVELHRGELVALIGANGAGKTTLLETVMGINPPHTGEIRFKGRRIEGMPSDRRARLGICFVPEGRGVFNTMSVGDNLLLGAYHRSRGARARLEKVYSWFPQLSHRGAQIASTLSGGERRMLALARVLMAEPEVIMVDEPSLGLAPIVVREVFSTLLRLKAEGYTILLSEQNAALALESADRVYVMETGRVALSGTADRLLADGAVRDAYLGVS
jgi:branched-chain amino acid transport system ATP-binding protein